MKKEAVGNALLEIGVEELPARFITPALQQLESLVKKKLESHQLDFKSVSVVGTPRRLAVLISGLPLKTPDRVDESIGPPPKAAKDSNGKWTQAALGFAKAQKVSVSQLELKDTPKGQRYVASHHVKGAKTDSVLKDLFPALIRQLTFPKSMIWDDPDFRFARPIRWLVSLFNSKTVRFQLAGVTADKTTIGLLSLGGKKIPISKPERYKSILQGRCIVVDPEERKKKILSQLESLSKKVKGRPVVDAVHLDEVINLTEYPTSLLGHFPQSYLSLPREILISVLRKHQKFFPLETSKQTLLNAFVGVRNGLSEAQDSVREGYERVLNARLADAQFFYDHDVKIPLTELANRLNEVGFHEKLGTLKDKMKRVRSLVQNIGSALNIDNGIIEKAQETATLAKADLLTQIVGEFPEIQGVAGRFYAQAQKMDAAVATGIEEHYWPLTGDGKLPASPLSALVSLADKLDTLAGNFYVGNIPSGSADPYGLRRASVGVVRILLDQKWSLSLYDLVDMAFEFNSVYENKGAAVSKLKEFFHQRCQHWFENQGYRNDEVEAVLTTNGDSLQTISLKLKGIKAVRGRPEFFSLAGAIKRAQNILKQAHDKGILPTGSELNQAELTESVERDLFNALQGTMPKVNSHLKNHNFQEAILHLAPLKEPVDQFFEGVMVMVDDEKIRNQRLALLMSIEKLFKSLADFSKLQATPSSKKN